MPPWPIFVHCAVGSELVLRHALHNNVMNETTTKIFPYLERLLDGEEVEWKTLGEVAELYAGLSGKNKEHFQKGNAPYVTYKNIFENLAVDSSILEMVSIEADERQHAIKYGDILITGSSENIEEVGMASVVTFHPETEIYLNSFSFGIRFHSAIQLSPEFTKYLFRSDLLRKQIMKTASGVTRFNVSKKKFLAITLPVPPLRVQARIVEILDKFTQLEAQLEAELQAELEARRKQYAYYRDQLLNFLQPPPLNVNVEWKTLGEVAELIRGNGLSKKDFSEFGIPAIHYGQIYTYYGNETEETLSFVSPETAKKLQKVYPGNIVITNTSENIEDVCKSVLYSGNVEAVTGGHATIIRPKDYILSKYLVYYTLTLDFFTQKKRLAKGTKVIDVSAKDLAKIVIPLPPLSEQHRIVDILDRFDTLINSISEGLPKEIALRRKQYEYYRDALLNFPRAEVTV